MSNFHADMPAIEQMAKEIRVKALFLHGIEHSKMLLDNRYELAKKDLEASCNALHEALGLPETRRCF